MANTHRIIGQSMALLDTFRLYERSSRSIWNTIRHIDDRIISMLLDWCNKLRAINSFKNVILFILKIFDQFYNDLIKRILKVRIKFSL